MLLLSFQSSTKPKEWHRLQALSEAESIESMQMILSALSLETTKSSSIPSTCTMVIQHDSLIQPAADNVDRDWYNLYTAVDHVKKLKSSEDTEVYICTLSITEPSKLDVVCKIKRGTSGIEELRDEHDCYVKLRDLQGQEIPKCYGLFQSSGDAYSRDRASRRSTWACLVLAYCGERPPNGDLMCMPWEFKEQFLVNLQTIHRLGVIHRDVCKPGNVIEFNGKPVIVDFGNASCDHVCGQTEAIPFDVIAPYDRLCYEIAEAAKETWLWRARILVGSHGTQIPADLLENEEKTPEEKIEEIVTRYTPQIDSEVPIDRREIARAEVKRYHKLMELRDNCMRPPRDLGI